MKKINVMTKAWNPLSMTHKSEIPLLFRGRVYPDIYRCIYSNIFPSRHDEILNSAISSLKNQKLSLEKFEISEEECLTILGEIIDVKYNTDTSFMSTLNKTKGKKIMNYDFSDYYFGYPANVYGIALMRYRQSMFAKIN